MASAKTPTLDKWKKGFSTTTKTIGKLALLTGGIVLPETFTNIGGAVEISKQALPNIRSAAKSVKQTTKIVSKQLTGMDAKKQLRDAVKDLDVSNVFGTSESEAEEMRSDFEDDMGGWTDDDGNSIEADSDTVNTAKLGVAIASGTAANVRVSKEMTDTLAKVHTKNVTWLGEKLTNVHLLGVNQTLSALSGVNSRLDMINKNLVNMINFQSSQVVEANRAAAEYYSSSTAMLNKMGESLSLLVDMANKQKDMSVPKKAESLFGNGFDVRKYFKNVVKKNVSSATDTFGMVGSVMEMMLESDMDVNLFQMALPMMLEFAMPNKIKKSGKTLDKAISGALKNYVYKMGEWQNGGNFVQELIGNIFGVARGKNNNALPDLANFRKDAMGWNGEAQKTLVEVIPSYLASMEKSLMILEMRAKKKASQEGDTSHFNTIMGVNSRLFSMDKGKFFKSSDLTKQYREKMINTTHQGMYDFTEEIKDTIAASSLTDDQIRIALKMISDIVTNQTMSTKPMPRTEARQKMANILINFMPTNKVNTMIALMDRQIDDVIEANAEATSNLDAGIRQLFADTTGRHGKIKDITAGYDIFSAESLLSSNADYRRFSRAQSKKGFWDKVNPFKGSNALGGVSSFMENLAGSVYKASGGYQVSEALAVALNNDAVSSEVLNNLSDATREATSGRTASPSEIRRANDMVAEQIENSESSTNAIVAYLSSIQRNFITPFINKFRRDNSLGERLRDDLRNPNTIVGRINQNVRTDVGNRTRHALTGLSYTDRNGNEIAASNDSILGHITSAFDKAKSAIVEHFNMDNENIRNWSLRFKYDKWKQKREARRAEGFAIRAGRRAPSGESRTNSDGSTTGSDSGEEPPIQSRVNQLADALVGSNTAEDVSNRITSAMNRASEVSFKKYLPSAGVLGAGALLGAGFGVAAGMGGLGMIGNLFLPGGPIGGALLGIGITLLSKNKSFMDFVFGKKDENGDRVGGLISARMSNFVRQNWKALAGGAAVGFVKGIFFPNPGRGMGGFLLNTLLPGGPIGGALMGLGFSILKKNETFTKILFGKGDMKDKDYKSLTKRVVGGLGKIVGKTGDLAKGALKGAATGLGAGALLSGAGVVGGALATSGPIGMAMTGLGIGILSQTEMFRRLLFGEKEFDENGNYIGRVKNGLIYQFWNNINVRLLESISNSAKTNMAKLAYWMNKNILYKFRMAFGPLIDSFKDLKQDVVDVVREVFHNVGKSVKDAFVGTVKKLTSPLLGITRMLGKLAIGATTTGIEWSLAPISMGLSAAGFLSRRFTDNLGSREISRRDSAIRSNANSIRSIAKRNWKDRISNEIDESDERYEGLGGFFRKWGDKIAIKSQEKKKAWNTAFASWAEAKTNQGRNSLGYLDARGDLIRSKEARDAYIRDVKSDEKLRKIRSKMVKEFNGKEIRFSDEELTRRKAKLSAKFKKITGIELDDEALGSNKAMDMFVNHYGDWRDKYVFKQMSPIEKMAEDGVKTASSERKEDKEYMTGVHQRLDKLGALFYKMSIKDTVKNHKNMSISELGNIEKDMKQHGLTWEAIGIRPSDLVNSANIDDTAYQHFLDARARGSKVTYDQFVRSQITREAEGLGNGSKAKSKGKIKSRNGAVLFNPRTGTVTSTGDMPTEERMVSALESIAANTQASATVDLSELAPDMTTRTRIQRGTGLKISTRQMSFLRRRGAIKSENERLAREAQEQAHAQALSVRNRPKKDDKSENESAAKVNGIGGFDEDGNPIANDGTKKKGFFKSIPSFLVGLPGFMYNFLQTKLGWLGMAIFSIYGKQITDFIGEHVVPVVKDKIIPGIGSVVGNAFKFVTSNLPNLVAQMVPLILNNIGNMISIIASTAGAIIKGSVNWLKDRFVNVAESVLGLGGGYSQSKSGQVFESEEVAREAARIQNKNAYRNMILGENEDINPDGTISKVQDVHRRLELGKGVRNILAYPGTRAKGAKLFWNTMKAGSALSLKPAYFFASSFLPKPVKSAAKFVGGKAKSVAGWAKDKVLGRFGRKAVDAAHNNIRYDEVSKIWKQVDTVTDVAKSKMAKAKTFLLGIVDKIRSLVAGFGNMIKKFIPEGVWSKFSKMFGDKIKAAIAKTKDTALISKLEDTVKARMGEATGRTFGAFIPFVPVLFAAYDLVSGALSASHLFKVREEDVDLGMRAISSAMEIITGLPGVAYFNLGLVMCEMLFGWSDVKAMVAQTIYRLFGGNDNLDRASKEFQKEVDKYNRLNGTNLSADEYNHKVNGSKGLLSQAWKGARWLKSKATFWDTSDDEKWRRDYDFSRYKTNTTSDAGISNVKTINGTKKLVFGKGISSANSSYANSAFRQDNSAWANYPLGTFKNGKVSTMKDAGCGPTALANTVNAVYGAPVTPVDVAKTAKDYGHIVDGGSGESLFTDGARRYGLRPKALSKSNVKDALSSGMPVVIAGKSDMGGPYTQAGHILSVTGMDRSGNAIVTDPMRGKRVMPINKLTSKMTHGWAYSRSNSVGYGPMITSVGQYNYSYLKNGGDTTTATNSSFDPMKPQYYDSRIDREIVKFGGLKEKFGYDINTQIKSGTNLAHGEVDEMFAQILKYDADIKELLKEYKHKPVSKMRRIKRQIKAIRRKKEELLAKYNAARKETSAIVISPATIRLIRSGLVSKIDPSIALSLMPKFMRYGKSTMTIEEARRYITAPRDVFMTPEEVTKYNEEYAKTMIDNNMNMYVGTAIMPISKVADKLGLKAKNSSVSSTSNNISDFTSVDTPVDTIYDDDSNPFGALMRIFGGIAGALGGSLGAMLGGSYSKIKNGITNAFGVTPITRDTQFTTGDSGATVSTTGASNPAAGNEDYNKDPEWIKLAKKTTPHTLQEYWKLIGPPVAVAAKKYELPHPEITMVQSAIESGWGRSGLAYHHNNFFGVTGKYNGRYVPAGTKEAGRDGIIRSISYDFRDYPSIQDSVEDHARLVSTSSRYKDAYSNSTSGIDYLNRLLSAGYAGPKDNVGHYLKMVSSTYDNHRGVLSNYTRGALGYGYGTGSRIRYSRPGVGRAVGYGPIGSWMETCAKVKAAIAAASAGYSQKSFIPVKIGDMSTQVRQDCSGLIEACVFFYTGKKLHLTSRILINSGGGLAKLGFVKKSFISWQDCMPGDIVAEDGHTEIFVRMNGTTPMIYNCGDNYSCNTPGLTTDGITKKYTTVWRLDGDVGTYVGSNSASTSALDNMGGAISKQAEQIMSPAEEVAQKLSNVFSKEISNAFGGSKTNVGNGVGSAADRLMNSLGGAVTSSYGKRSGVFGDEYHRGVDIGAIGGSKIKSPISGTVVSTGSDPVGFGNYTVIRDGEGNEHIFGHLGKPVGYGVGSPVGVNDIIGEVGSTGKSTGNHVHYEIRKKGGKYSTVDPFKFKPKSLTDHMMDDSVGYGTSEGTIASSISDKTRVNVTLDSKTIEKKLDIVISHLASIKDIESNKSKSSNGGNITNVNNFSYNGSKLEVSGKNKSKETNKANMERLSLAEKALREMHDMIAKK